MIKRRRKAAFAAVGGILTAFCYVAGYPLDNYDSLNLTETAFYIKWLAAGLGIGILLYAIWELVDRLEAGGKSMCPEKKGKMHMPRLTKLLSKPHAAYGICVIFLLLCWLPALLSLFPGAFAYDAHQEWQQVRDGAVTAHHPVIHVLILGGLVEGLYQLTGSYNAGIAVYTVLQMLFMANVFTITLRFLKRFHVPVWLRAFALVFYGFSPVIQLFSICATKDVPFGGLQLLFFLYVIYFYVKREEMLGKKKHLLGFGIVSFFTMIFRNNGLYIVLITLLFMTVSMVKGVFRKNVEEAGRRDFRKSAKRFGCVLLGILAAYGLYVGPFYQIFDVTPGGVEEMLSVPLQQMARVHRYDYASLEEEDLELLYSVIPRENLEEYRATVSDFVKRGFQAEAFSENKAEFIKLWVKWGLEHPLTYANSFLINTVDFWYPKAVVDGYRDAYGKSSYFDYQVDEPGTEMVFLPGLHTYYEAISFDGQVQKLPFAFLVLSPGWYFVMFLVIFFYLWRCRKMVFFVPLMIFALTLFTVLLGPMALVRYVLIFYYGFPVLLALFLYPGRFMDAEEKTAF